MPGEDKQELFNVIDQEALDERESQESKAIYDALSSHRSELSATADLPDDPGLNRAIHQEAERRSQEISIRSSTVSLATPRGGKPIPTWVWMLWATVIVGAIAAWLISDYLIG